MLTNPVMIHLMNCILHSFINPSGASPWTHPYQEPPSGKTAALRHVSPVESAKSPAITAFPYARDVVVEECQTNASISPSQGCRIIIMAAS